MSNDLGLDRSGNGNNWTVNNLAYSDVMVDSPSNNFPTWDALRGLRPSLFEGNLLTETSTNTVTRSIDSNFRPVSGKWYVEVYMKVVGSGENTQVGIANDGFVAGNEFKGHNNGVSYAQNGQKGLNNSMSSYGATYTAGDIIGIAYDVDNSNVTFYKNGASQGAITSGWDGSNGRVVVATNSSTATGQRYAINFGQDSSFAGLKTAQGNQDGNDIGDFYYAPPTGFLALCTSNLPDVAVVPSENFNTVLYTGNSSTNAITGVGFQPDFTWFKCRSETRSHSLVDSVRGFNGTSGRVIQSASTNAEWESAYINSLNSDGFTVSGSENYINNSSHTYVAWNWKAGNATLASNAFTQGSIASTCSRNVDAGFSIVSWTGTGSAGTVGHGLSKKPEMILVKRRDDATGWRVFHDANAANYHLVLETTAARASSSSIFNNTEPTASLFTVGAGGSVNESSGTFIAYCFHSVDGYSKVSSYIGNASADGTNVYTGFKPAYVMTKQSSTTGDWTLHDSARDIDNPLFNELTANSSGAEGTSDADMDFTSNGFKIRRASGQFNASGATVLYLAFAEQPFKYSNAR